MFFFNGYRAIGPACTKYQRLKEISMKEERPGQGPRWAATKADGVPHSRSQNEVTSSLTRTFGDATDPAWFTCRGQCYGYASIKIRSPANKMLLCDRYASNRSRFGAISQVPAGRASFTYLQAGGCSSSDTPSEKEGKGSTKGRHVVPGQKPR